MKSTAEELKKLSPEEMMSRIMELEKRNHDLEIQHRLDQENIANMRKLLFGRKAEQKSQIDPDGWHQDLLFDDVDAEIAIEENKEKIEELVTVAEHQRKKRERIDLSKLGLEEIVSDHKAVIPEGMRKVCDIGWDTKRTLVWVPAHGYVRVDRYQTVKCIDGSGDERIVTAGRDDPEMLRGSIASPELVASVIHDKFVMHLPLYRQEQEFSRKGIPLSRVDLLNYVSRFARWAKPVHDLIADYIKSADNSRADETPLNVIELNGTKARLAGTGKSKSYVWMFATAEGYEKAFDYVLGPGRDYAVPRDYLPVLEGGRYLQSDAYEAYSCLASSDHWTNIPCMAHIRRKFADIVRDDPKLSSDSARHSDAILSYIGSVYEADRRIHEEAKGDYDAIKDRRNEILKPMLGKLFDACDAFLPKALPKSKFHRALEYASNRRKGMMNVLLDGRLTLDNNYSEREGIKPLVMGRKNWLFADTRKGAEVTCELFSLMQTALANGLDPYRYVVWLAENLPQPTTAGYDWSKFLPWSEEIPEDIRAERK